MNCIVQCVLLIDFFIINTAYRFSRVVGPDETDSSKEIKSDSIAIMSEIRSFLSLSISTTIKDVLKSVPVIVLFIFYLYM